MSLEQWATRKRKRRKEGNSGPMFLRKGRRSTVQWSIVGSFKEKKRPNKRADNDGLIFLNAVRHSRSYVPKAFKRRTISSFGTCLLFTEKRRTLSLWKNSIPSVKKRKKFLGIEGEVVSCVSEIVLLFLNVSETQSRDDLIMRMILSLGQCMSQGLEMKMKGSCI